MTVFQTSYEYSGIHVKPLAGVITFQLTTTTGNVIEYVQQDTIKGYHSTDGFTTAPTLLVQGTDWDFDTTGRFVVLSAPASGPPEEFVWRRETPLDQIEQLHNGQILTEEDILIARTLQLHRDQENRDRISAGPTGAIEDLAQQVSDADAKATDALTKSSSAVATANAAQVTANDALNSINSLRDSTIAATINDIPSSPSANEFCEVLDSTNIQDPNQFSPLTGVPAGFVGGPGIVAVIQRDAQNTTWQWNSYRVDGSTRLQDRGEWLSINSYATNDVVTVGPWTLVATTDHAENGESPAPIYSGPSTTGHPDTGQSWTTSSTAKSVLVSMTVTFAEAGQVQFGRILIPTIDSDDKQVFIAQNITSPSDIVQMSIVPAAANEWAVAHDLGLLVQAGDQYKFSLLAVNEASTSQWSNQWTWEGNGTSPTAGKIVASNGKTTLSIAREDAGGSDYGTDLSDIKPGSQIKLSDNAAATTYLSFLVTGVTALTSSERVVDVVLIDRAGTLAAGTLVDVDAINPALGTTDYVEIANYWPSNLPSWATTITGSFEKDGIPQGGTTNTGYGIDISFQKLALAPGWSVLSGPPGGDGSDAGVAPLVIPAKAIDEPKLDDQSVSERTYQDDSIPPRAYKDDSIPTSAYEPDSVDDDALLYPLAPGVSSINGGPLAGKRNALLNGTFAVWQSNNRTVVLDSTTTAGYGPDQWYGETNGSTMTMTREDLTFGSSDVPGRPRHHIRCDVTSVSASINYAKLTQPIEGADMFSGQNATASVYLRSPSGTKKVGIALRQHFGSGGSAAVEKIGWATVAITSAWKKYTVPFAVPTVHGKIRGTDDYLEFQLWFDAGTSVDNSNDPVGHQTAVFDVATPQLEPGEYATPFEQRDELPYLFRYYEKSYNIDVEPGATTADGMMGGDPWTFMGGSTFRAIPIPPVQYKVTKYKQPTLSLYDRLGNVDKWSQFYDSQWYADNQQSGGQGPDIVSNGLNSFAISPIQTNATQGVAVTMYHWTSDARLR